jgi:hypothetical protein
MNREPVSECVYSGTFGFYATVDLEAAVLDVVDGILLEVCSCL